MQELADVIDRRSDAHSSLIKSASILARQGQTINRCADAFASIALEVLAHTKRERDAKPEMPDLFDELIGKSKAERAGSGNVLLEILELARKRGISVDVVGTKPDGDDDDDEVEVQPAAPSA